MRQILFTLLALVALACIVPESPAQQYGRFATPRSQHPRSTYGSYRSYPRNYAESQYGPYGFGGWGNRYGGPRPGAGWSWGASPYGFRTYPGGSWRPQYRGGYYR